MKQPNKALKVIKITLSVIFYIIIGLLLLFSITTLTRKKEDQIPHLFGIGFLSVQTDSMVGDNKDSFNIGDLLIVEVMTEKKAKKLKLNTLVGEDDGTGKVITFFDDTINNFNSHRAVKYFKSGEVEYVLTQGDNSKLTELDDKYIYKSDVKAIYKGKIRGAGKVLDFMQTMLGFGLVVMLPMLLLLIWQGYLLISNIFEVKQEKLALEKSESTDQLSEEDRKRIEEEERERIRQELLKELQEEKENNKDKEK